MCTYAYIYTQRQRQRDTETDRDTNQANRDFWKHKSLTAHWQTIFFHIVHCLPQSLNTENKMSSFWWNFHHWLYWKLSKWQLPVQPVIKISSKWRHFCFSECVLITQGIQYFTKVYFFCKVHFFLLKTFLTSWLQWINRNIFFWDLDINTSIW